MAKAVSHLVIPDTQVKPGIDLTHFDWIGQYIVDRRPDVVVHIGDHWDMPSLSSYDKGKKAFEGRRYKADVEAGNEAMDRINHQLRKLRQRQPRKILLRGNHETRITRAIEDDATLDGTIGFKDLQAKGWETYEFLQPVEVNGISYCHYFPRGANGAVNQSKRGAPNARAQLIREGGSCTSGHQQGLDVACLPLRGKLQWGLIAGSCYRHEEAYLTPQGTSYWRGVIVKHEVNKGGYCPMFVSLDYLQKRYGK